MMLYIFSKMIEIVVISITYPQTNASFFFLFRLPASFTLENCTVFI